MNVLKLLTFGIFLLGAAAPLTTHAQEFQRDIETLEKARVISVIDRGEHQIPGTEVTSESQFLSAEILTGAQKGEVVSFTNDFVQLQEGDQFYLRHLVSPTDGTEFYSVADPYRLHVLIILTVVFVGLVFCLEVFKVYEASFLLLEVCSLFSMCYFQASPQGFLLCLSQLVSHR